MDIAQGEGKCRRAGLIGLAGGDSGAAVRQELRAHYTLLSRIYWPGHF